MPPLPSFTHRLVRTPWFLVRRVGLRERGAITHARHPRTARFSSLDPSFGRYFQSEYFKRDRGAKGPSIWKDVTTTRQGQPVQGLVQRIKLPSRCLRGELPKKALGNLTNLTVLDLRGNALKGELPKELPVSLKKLILGKRLGNNNNEFTGGIPSEWGALANLKQLEMDCCGLDGKLLGTPC